MTDYSVSLLLPAALDRLGKKTAILHRDINSLFPSGALPLDPRARAPLVNAAEDLLEEARGVTKQLEGLLEILRRP